jgi:hypothetical protein
MRFFDSSTPNHEKKLQEHKKYLLNEKELLIRRTEFVRTSQNHEKMIGTPNQPIKMKSFPKKTMFSPLKVKRSHSYGSYSTEFTLEASKTSGLKLN